MGLRRTYRHETAAANRYDKRARRHCKRLRAILFPLLAACLLPLLSCSRIDDDRIPALAVYINLGEAGMWNTYGVAGYGQCRYFVISTGAREPAGFPYGNRETTGFGGVMLISGMDPFNNNTGVPLAYDMACPVERRSDVRVRVSGELYEAVCPVCGSHYDVTMGGGTPLSGPAAEGKYKYGLRRYQCLPTQTGGYVVTN